MLLGILLAVLIVVCIALVGVILLQRSEGGALGMSGGGPGAFMTARGTGDLLTRTTQILAAVFFGLCLIMTLISGHQQSAADLIQKVKGLPPASAASAAAPLAAAQSAAPQQQQPAANPFSQVRPFAQPVQQQPQARPQPNNNPLNLLGTPQTQPLSPTAQLQQQLSASSTPPAKTAKRQPKAHPATSSSGPPAPSVQTNTVALPPPPAAAPAPTNQ